MTRHLRFRGQRAGSIWEAKEISFPYPIASSESFTDNTYLSYNTVVGNVLDKELYLAFEVLEYALLNAPGAPLKKALIDAGIGKDIMGSYDNGIYQRSFRSLQRMRMRSRKKNFYLWSETC